MSVLGAVRERSDSAAVAGRAEHFEMGIASRAKVARVRLTNDCYLITLQIGSGVEHYYRHGDGWVKLSTRGRRFPATAEQVLNHLLPALAGVKPGVTVQVGHRDLSDRADQLLTELRAKADGS